MAAKNCDNSGKDLYKMKNFDETTFDIIQALEYYKTNYFVCYLYKILLHKQLDRFQLVLPNY